MIHYITTQGTADAWVVNELEVLRRAGIPFVLHAMRHASTTFHRSGFCSQLADTTSTLYPMRVLPFLSSILRAPLLFRERFLTALLNALFGQREHLRARVAAFWHFLVACQWATMLRHENVAHIHSQWAHSCCSIGMYAAWLLPTTFSFTGHGADIWRDRVALKDKIRRADFIICISKFHRDLYCRLGARTDQLHLVYLGIDVQQFSRPIGNKQPDNGILRIRSSGRLVEKKGFKHLIDACKVLSDRGEHFDCVIAGSGPLESTLRDRLAELGLANRVQLTGKPIMQEDIPKFISGCDVYCLPCVWASDNDADGLPQMLMEAMACGAPVISSRLVGIPDLILHNETGLLVEPGDVDGLVAAIERIHNEPGLAKRLANEGRRFVLEKFEINSALQPLIDLYRGRLGQTSDKRSTAVSTGSVA